MKLSEMRALLDAHGVRLTKSLGQCFLHDANQLRRMLRLARLTSQDRVLEVGPGLGPLTELLLEAAGGVLVIETDARLVRLLAARFAQHPKLSLAEGDALEHLRRTGADWTDWTMVSNLPYSAGSAILVELAQGATCPRRMVVTLQREVVQRLRAVPGTKDYGTLTVLVQARYQAGESFRIPPGSFFPAPRVESACVLLERRNEPLLPPGLLVAYAGLVKLAFCQRRKMAFKRLCQQWPAAALERAFAELDLPLTLRAEDIAVEQYAALTRRLPGPCCDPG